MRIYLTRFFSSFILLTIMPAMVQATEAANGSAATEGNSFNAMLIGLVSLALILLMAVLILGNTLLQLALVYRDKMRAKKTEPILPKLILLLLSLSLFTSQASAQDAPTAGASTAYISGIATSDFYLLMGIIFLELMVALSLILRIKVLVRLISNKPEAEAIFKEVRNKVPFWDRVNKIVPIEKEKDILLDHNYDGIQELDNSLPPWWKYGFYLSIVTAVIYLWYYHAGGDGPSSYDEYVTEVQKGEEAKAIYLAKSANNVDENTVKMLDASGKAAGQVIFETTCAACHAKDGGGGVGPNLTDEYWLHGGSLKDVFKTIKYGWADKGMKSWKDDFSPNQIAQIATYVKSLKGSHPVAPKDKQGDIYSEDSAPIVIDSTKNIAMK